MKEERIGYIPRIVFMKVWFTFDCGGKGREGKGREGKGREL